MISAIPISLLFGLNRSYQSFLRYPDQIISRTVIHRSCSKATRRNSGRTSQAVKVPLSYIEGPKIPHGMIDTRHDGIAKSSFFMRQNRRRKKIVIRYVSKQCILLRTCQFTISPVTNPQLPVGSMLSGYQGVGIVKGFELKRKFDLQ